MAEEEVVTVARIKGQRVHVGRAERRPDYWRSRTATEQEEQSDSRNEDAASAQRQNPG
jgi:hypothetical protein